MKFSETTETLICEDLAVNPKEIRFKEEFEDIELELLVECLVRQETFPIGTYAISLGNIAEGRWLFVKASADLGLSINGGAALTLRGEKTTRLWVNFTSLSITVSGNATEVLIALAGE